MSETCAAEVYLEESVQRSLQNRLSRLEGQIRGIRKMLAEHQSCDDILKQLAAVRGAVGGVARELLDGHMRTCVLESVRAGEAEPAFERLKGALDQFIRQG